MKTLKLKNLIFIVKEDTGVDEANPRNIGCVARTPEDTSWQYETWNGTGRCLTGFDTPQDALLSMLIWLDVR